MPAAEPGRCSTPILRRVSRHPWPVACARRGGGGAVLIGMGDQPLLTSGDIRALLAAHAAADTSRISIPALDQHRGNPILVPENLRSALLADPKSPGCRKFTRAHPEHVQFHALAAPGYYADVDTPEAYAALTADQPAPAPVQAELQAPLKFPL